MEWMDGVDTPQTVMTTRAPAVLKMKKKSRFENDEKAFFLSKEIHIVQNNLERDGANIAS